MQFVILENEKSDTVPVQSGVPQDSVLDPIQFLIYIKDLPDSGLYLIVLGFNDTSTLVGHFVSSPGEREKRDRRDSREHKRVTGKNEKQFKSCLFDLVLILLNN